MKPLSRRELFRATALVGLGAFAASCAKKVRQVTGAKSLAQITSGHAQSVQMNSGGLEILSGKPDRLVFNLIDPSNGNAITTRTATVWIARDQTSAATGPLTANYRTEGLPPDKGFYEVQLTVPSDGTWLAVAEVQRAGKSSVDFGATQFQVGPHSTMPKPGDQARSVATPTYSDHRGVNPICTAKPQCSMHAISLDVALKSGKPTVLIMATPQFCQSALCGPETDVVQSVSKGFAGRINFIHVEVYKDNKPTTIQQQLLSPGATQWRLDAEPAIYYIDADGLIKSRTIGPADTSEVRTAATALLS
jgi:hypothetical protein